MRYDGNHRHGRLLSFKILKLGYSFLEANKKLVTMKNIIHTIEDALAFQLQGLYYSEAKILSEFKNRCPEIESELIANKIRNYSLSAIDKTLKIERIFNYLMKEPVSRKNEVIQAMIHETHLLLNSTTSSSLRDTLVIGCLQNINAYKISGYKTAYRLAEELGIDPVCDLLQQILEWEYQSADDFAGVILL